MSNLQISGNSPAGVRRKCNLLKVNVYGLKCHSSPLTQKGVLPCLKCIPA